MYDVLLFFLKLCLFVGASIGAVAYMQLPEVPMEVSMFISSVQILLVSVVYTLYAVCCSIVTAIHSRQKYDVVEDDVGLEMELGLHDSDSQPELPSSELLPPLPGPDDRLAFGSINELNWHVVMVHFTGLLVWNTVISMDYTQPDVCYCFTAGVVVAWLLEAIVVSCKPSQPFRCKQSLQLFIYMMCSTMLASVNLLDARISDDKIVCVLTGMAWPFFFSPYASSLSRRPEMILHTVRSSLVTCVLLCVYPLVAWNSGPLDYPMRTLCFLFLVQPVVKVMCLTIICLSIQTGHKKDLLIVLSVASCVQFLFLYPLDRTYQIISILIISALLSIHVFCMCYSRRLS